MKIEREYIKITASRYIELYGPEAQIKVGNEISRATGLESWDDVLMWHQVKSRINRIEQIKRRGSDLAGLLRSAPSHRTIEYFPSNLSCC